MKPESRDQAYLWDMLQAADGKQVKAFSGSSRQAELKLDQREAATSR